MDSYTLRSVLVGILIIRFTKNIWIGYVEIGKLRQQRFEMNIGQFIKRNAYSVIWTILRMNWKQKNNIHVNWFFLPYTNEPLMFAQKLFPLLISCLFFNVQVRICFAILKCYSIENFLSSSNQIQTCSTCKLMYFNQL